MSTVHSENLQAAAFLADAELVEAVARALYWVDGMAGSDAAWRDVSDETRTRYLVLAKVALHATTEAQR